MIKIAVSTIFSKDNTDKKFNKFIELLKEKIDVDSYFLKFNSNNFPPSKEYVTEICEAKNDQKNEIFKNFEYDILIYVDNNLLTYPSIDIIIGNIYRLLGETNLAAISSFGVSSLQGNLIYYDIWSLIIDKKIQNHKVWMASEILDDTFVDSAYGGLAIYYGPVIKYINFIPVIVDGYPCSNFPLQRIGSEYCGVNLQLRQQNLKILISRQQITFK